MHFTDLVAGFNLHMAFMYVGKYIFFFKHTWKKISSSYISLYSLPEVGTKHKPASALSLHSFHKVGHHPRTGTAEVHPHALQ